ncbi:MAG: DUF1311 domain-containing protein [Bacteroidetes bacterium]|nr:MAG: DUF1311 domain-containing protein [Bacteroidota bacterium]
MKSIPFLFALVVFGSCTNENLESANGPEVDTVVRIDTVYLNSYAKQVLPLEAYERICADSSYSQAEMNECSVRMLAAADSVLNKRWTQVDSLIDLRITAYTSRRLELDEIERKQIEHLIKLKKLLGQMKWQFYNYRKSFVQVETTLWEGGSMAPIMYNGTAVSITKNQIMELEALLEEL